MDRSCPRLTSQTTSQTTEQTNGFVLILFVIVFSISVKTQGASIATASNTTNSIANASKIEPVSKPTSEISCLIGDPSKDQFVKQFQSLKKRNGLVGQFYKLQEAKNNSSNSNSSKSNSNPELQSEAFCPTCRSMRDSLNNLMNWAVDNLTLLGAAPQIQRACVQASMKRESGNVYFCESPQSAPISVGTYGRNGACITEEIADYTTWLTNEAIRCVHDVVSYHIDPRLTLLKYNNESHFGFFIASENGVGIGQMTSAALGDLPKNEFLKKVIASKKKSCQLFQKALQKPVTSIGSASYCSLVHIEDGFARSLIYSLVHFQQFREKYLPNLIPQMQNLNPSHRIYRDWAALALYGPEAMNNRSQILASYQTKPRDPNSFKENLAQRIPYIRDTLNKEKELLKILNTPEPNYLSPSPPDRIAFGYDKTKRAPSDVEKARQKKYDRIEDCF